MSPVGASLAASASCATVLRRKSNEVAGACHSGIGFEVNCELPWHCAQMLGELFGKDAPGSGPACGCVDDTNASESDDCMLWQVVQRGWRNLPASDWLKARVSMSCALIAATKTSLAPFVSVTVSRLNALPLPSASLAAELLVNATSITSRAAVLPIAGTTAPAATGWAAASVGVTPRSMPVTRFGFSTAAGVGARSGLRPRPDEQLITKVTAENRTMEPRARRAMV